MCVYGISSFVVLCSACFFFKQKTAYEMRISDWSSDVCSSDLRSVDAVLLDMDGTILNSIKAAERVWGEWALRHGLDVDAFLPTVHGVQSVETIRRLGLPGVDPVAEAALVTQAEIDAVEGRSEERRVGKECVSKGRSRWGPAH